MFVDSTQSDCFQWYKHHVTGQRIGADGTAKWFVHSGGETLLLPRVTQSLCARFTMTRFYFYYFRLCRVISNEQLLVQDKEEEKYS